MARDNHPKIWGTVENTVGYGLFDPTKGFGFIRPDIGEKDIFIHKTAVINSGLEYLKEGQKVTFLTEITAGGKVLVSSLTLAV